MEDSAAAVIASNPPIVIDNVGSLHPQGSGVIRAGFAHEEKPTLIFNN